jgi:HlyD family secretion protein
MNTNRTKLFASTLAVMLVALSGCKEGELTYMVGTLERDRVEVSVESNEAIIAIHAQDGQILQAGDLILEQDPARSISILAQQIALRDQANAKLAELQHGARQEDIQAARAQLASAQASALNAAETLKRAEVIYERQLSDKATLELAQTREKTAAATEQAARQALEKLLNGTRVEELQQAIAAVEAQQALIEQIELNINRLNVYAPVNGMFDKHLYQIGERPPVGSTVGIILDDSRTYARIYVPEPQRAMVQPGNQLNVRIDSNDKTYKGTVAWVSSDATFTPYFALTEHDRSRLSYLAEVDVPDAAALPSGVPLQVDLPVSSGSNK